MMTDNDYKNMKVVEEFNEQLQKENKALKNRCYALTQGTMCLFCPIDCDKRNTPYRGVVEEQTGENT